MAHHCKNHPQVVTRKRCTLCQSYICPECTRLFHGRPFCSTHCLLRSLLEQSKIFFTTPGPAKTKKQRPLFSWSQISRILIHGIYLSLFLTLWLSMRRISQQVSADRQPASQVIDSTTVQDTLIDRSRVLLTQPAPAQVTQNTIDILGEAADNISISLLLNGRLKAVTISQNGRFSFEKVVIQAGDNELVVRGLDENGNVSMLEKIITLKGQPVVSITAADFSRGPSQHMQIALTFDGGSGDGSAEAILNYLAEKKVSCTFFLTGAFMKRYPEIVRRIVQEGHEVGNHTWSHPRLTTVAQNRLQTTRSDMSREKLQHELTQAADYFTHLTGKPMARYWRAPFGEHNREIRGWAAELGYTHVGWTIANGQSLDALDWVADKKHPGYQSSEKILSRLLAFGRDSDLISRGGIILMHLDSQRIDDPVHPILPSLIDSLHRRGYDLVTISQMQNAQ